MVLHIHRALEPTRQEASRICGENVTLEPSVTSGPNINVLIRIGAWDAQTHTRGDGKSNMDELRAGILQAAEDYKNS